MNVETVAAALDRIAPLRHAAEWDNVGLLVGMPQWSAQHVLLTIDLTEPVLEEAIASNISMIVAYHPPIFHAIKSLNDATPASRIALRTANAGIAVFSPHTALDAASGGVNDWLAQGLGTGEVYALEPAEDLPPSEQCKIVTHVPQESVEAVRDSLASSGAGRIGLYEYCSFELHGRGTFVGGEGTNPAVGESGRLHYVEEVRLEMVCPRSALASAVLALKQAHPYEEPPIEIHPLLARPQRHAGLGRRVRLDSGTTLKPLLKGLKQHLGRSELRVALGYEAPDAYQTIGLCAGAGGSLLPAALAEGCQMFVTGEMTHHDVLSAQAANCTVVLAGHTNTERGYLKLLCKRLQSEVQGIEVRISEVDDDPLRSM
jgi:dinuclear metal center YbgI/SA1388 family protein